MKNLIATLKNWLHKLTGPAPGQPVAPEEELFPEAVLSLGERFNLEIAPTPTEAEDTAVMGTDAQIITHEEAQELARAASQKYSVFAVHVDPATARVRVSDTGEADSWYWAVPDAT